MTIQPSTTRRNSHDTHRSVGVTEAQCPYCGQGVSRREFEEIKARIEAEEKARIGKVEQALKDRFTREQKQAQANAKAEVQKAKRDASKAAEAQLKALRASQEETITQRLAAQRETLVKQAAEVINAERTKVYAEKLALEQQLEDLKRRVQRKSAHELGEPGEAQLYEILVEAFPEDRVSRIVKGVKGPDILVEVFHKELFVGKIVIDCKNHKRWANAFTKKLRDDQISEGADFAILSTSTFPKGTRQLYLQDHVIVADPARVVVLAHLLRRAIIQNYVLKLSAEARAEKSATLYALMTSDKVADLWERHGRTTDGLLGIEKSDAAWQEKTRGRRTELILACQGIRDDIVSAIDAIISTAEPTELEAAR